MSLRKGLTDAQLREEMERIMNGEDSDPDPFEESGSDWEEDHLELKTSESGESDDEFDIAGVSSQQNNPNNASEPNSPTTSQENQQTEDTDDMTETISNQSQPTSSAINSYIVKPKRVQLIGKNGHKWSAELPVRGKRTASRNIIHFLSGPKGIARELNNIEDYFLHFFSDNILDIIVQHTNEEIFRQAKNYKCHSNVSQITKDELKGLLSILILSAAKKDNHLSAKHMFDFNISGRFYRACMSCDRFTFLVNCLRFDYKETRQERKITDPFAHIREIWDMFIETCRTSYAPSSYLTIDEQLLGFRCPFRMYIPNKPSKYGIKIVMMCDSSTKYMVDASPYLGKKTPTNGLPLAEYYVKQLSKSVHGSNRNVTMDNWFTSVSLADQLLEDPYKLTIIGTLRKNKREIPPELLDLKNRNANTSMFCFDKKKTLLSYMPKKQKVVLLLSTMHEGAEILEGTHKPAIIQNYNETKAGVDTFDQMCSNINCSRKTKRWPLCVFYGMLNMACINSYVLYSSNMLKKGQKPVSRYQFMIDLSHSLADPWMRHRISIKNLRRDIRADIGAILNIPELPEEPGQGEPQERKRKMCFYCPSKKRRMTTVYCNKCSQPICGEHRGNVCTKCAAN